MGKVTTFKVTDVELCDNRLTFYIDGHGPFACHGRIDHNDAGTGGHFKGTIATPIDLHNYDVQVQFDGPDGTCTILI